MSLNHIVLIGHLGKAPEVLKNSEEGVFIGLSLATNKTYVGSDGVVKQDTQWHSVYVSNGRAKAAVEYLDKGSKVCVRGELRYREIQDKKGNTHYLAGIYAQEIIFLDAKSQDNAKMHVDPLEESEACTMEVANDDVMAAV